jgi:YidC/Oxa1 family membrane protein insertase
VFGSAGIAIIIYTVITKALTFPIYQPALKTNALMRLIKPQVEQIQTQYKDNEKESTRLVRALYEKVGANPVNGLLPTFAQLPVFVALYSAIRKLALNDEHFKEPFLWIPSLSGPTMDGNASLDWFLRSRVENGFEPLVGWQNAGLYLILPVVLVTVQLGFAKLTSPSKEPDAVTLAFPFIIGISTLVSPQGLGIYWLTNSCLSLAQTQLARTEADSEFPELKEIWEAYSDKPDEVRQGDKVVLNGREGVVVYGPDTDNECKVAYEDGSESGFVKAYALRRRGSKLDKVVSELEGTANDPEVFLPPKPKSRAVKRKQKRQAKSKRQRTS